MSNEIHVKLIVIKERVNNFTMEYYAVACRSLMSCSPTSCLQLAICLQYWRSRRSSQNRESSL